MEIFKKIMTSYQKLKKENQKLKKTLKDIADLIEIYSKKNGWESETVSAYIKATLKQKNETTNN